MDTKGREAAFVKSCLEEAGVRPVIMDAGIRGESPIPTDVTRREVALAGGKTLDEVRGLGHEGESLAVMIAGAVSLARKMFEEGRFQGVLGLGGSMGTTLGTAVMRSFPVGVPKVMISTMASRDTRAFVGTRDIMMIHAVCDLAGLNRITRLVLRNGAMAAAGMATGRTPDAEASRPLVALSTLGTTEVTAQAIRDRLDALGLEVVTFHTVGAGGQAMDEMILDGEVQAVIDLSLHELTDHRFGGDYDAGPDRAMAAGRKGVPTVLVPGNVDFLVSGPVDKALAKFPGRTYHIHNAAITCLRTSRKEMASLGRAVADVANQARGPIAVVTPTKGFSAFDHPELGPMRDPEGPRLFHKGLSMELRSDVKSPTIDCHVNDPEFPVFLIETLASLWDDFPKNRD
jgi:uncharacterized protein (UPF0261 family)